MEKHGLSGILTNIQSTELHLVHIGCICLLRGLGTRDGKAPPSYLYDLAMSEQLVPDSWSANTPMVCHSIINIFLLTLFFNPCHYVRCLFSSVLNCRKQTLRPKIPQPPEVRALQPLAQVRVVPLPRPPPLWPVLFPSPSCCPNLAPSTHSQV